MFETVLFPFGQMNVSLLCFDLDKKASAFLSKFCELTAATFFIKETTIALSKDEAGLKSLPPNSVIFTTVGFKWMLFLYLFIVLHRSTVEGK